MTYNVDPRDEYSRGNLALWERTLKDLFPDGIPDSQEWERNEDIISLLAHIGSVEE